MSNASGQLHFGSRSFRLLKMEPIEERDDLTKEEVIQLAMDCFQWKELKCLSWYKIQNRFLGGNSPKELVQRGQTAKIVVFLKQKAQDRLRGQAPKDGEVEDEADDGRFKY